MTGRLWMRLMPTPPTHPVSVPQGSWAVGLQQEECDYLQMIKVQHKQCLEEAQLENETSGEAPTAPQGACFPLHMSPGPGHIHSTYVGWG